MISVEVKYHERRTRLKVRAPSDPGLVCSTEFKVCQFSCNRRSSEIQGTALGKSLRAWTCIYRSRPAGVVHRRHAFCWGYSEHVGKMTDTRKQKAEKASKMPIKHSLLAGNVQIG